MFSKWRTRAVGIMHTALPKHKVYNAVGRQHVRQFWRYIKEPYIYVIVFAFRVQCLVPCVMSSQTRSFPHHVPKIFQRPSLRHFMSKKYIR